MKEIIILSFSYLRVSESIQFFHQLIKILNKYGAEKLGIGKPLQSTTETLKVAEEGFKKLSNGKFTEELVNLDQQRDDGIICLRFLAEGYSRHFNPELKSAGEKVLETIDKYGSRIYSLSYEAETSVLRNLINDLTMVTELIAAVDAINASDIIIHLKDTNEKFDEILMKKNTESAFNDEVAAGTALKDTINEYRMLVRYLESQALLNPGEDIENAIQEVNSLISRYDSIVQIRRSGNDEEEQDKDNNESIA